MQTNESEGEGENNQKLHKVNKYQRIGTNANERVMAERKGFEPLIRL